MKLFVDQNLAEDLTSALNQAGHDAVQARELGLERATHPGIFRHCCDQQ